MPRILVPVDFSEASQAMIHHVLAYTDGLLWDVLLLHVVEEESDTLGNWMEPWATMFGGPYPWENMYGDLCDEAASKLAVSLPFARTNQIHTLVAVGKTVDEIIKVATEHDVDLIVMRASQRGLLRRLFVESVTDHVLRRATTPVELDHWDLHQACRNPAPEAARDLFNAPLRYSAFYLLGDALRDVFDPRLKGR